MTLLAEIQKLDTPNVEFSTILPVLLLLGGAVLLLVIGSFLPKRSKTPWHATFTLVTAGAAIISSVVLWFRVRDDGAIRALGDTVRIDGITVFLTIVIAAGVILTALLTDGYLRRERLEGPEAYVLLLLSASGGVIMASANDLVVLFLGLEILSIAVYVLAGLHIRRARSGEAAIKYFVLGAFSSAFLLYGIALVYGATGSTNLTAIQSFLARNILTNNVGLLAGFAFLLVGLGFKVAAVPFHSWAPDVYDGSPSPVVAYMASGVKTAGFAGLIRVFVYGFETSQADWRPIVAVLVVLTMVIGSVLMVSQTNVKRMLAYSSISHAGFILLGIDAATDRGVSAMLFYLATYTFTVAGSFGIATVVGRAGDNSHTVDQYRGLAKRSPFLAFCFMILLLAQAGVPLTTGFVAKFMVLGSAVDVGRYWLALVGMVSAVISAYAYLRFVLAMYGEDSEEGAPKRYKVPVGAKIAISASVIVTLVFGFYPSPLLQASRTAAPIASAAPQPTAAAQP
ncbi:MAG: NADH-quinone oxidoreductase subunit N [Acidimicrobiales bacterium]|nr:NADH-quinone oxidoreductase subunit N [Acidimicrobiales bacterium]